jgi:hypothetical protein
MKVALFDILAQHRITTPSDALINFLPIALFLVVLFFVFRRQVKTVKTQQDDIQRRLEHMQRVEELLERIAKALEQRR